MRQCPRCASEITQNDKVCPRCGLPVSKMGFEKEELADELEKQAESKRLNRAQKLEKKRLAKLAKKEAKKQKKLAREESTTDFSKYANNYDGADKKYMAGKKKRRRRGEETQFDIDENGELNIDTADVEIIGEETAKKLEEHRQQTYSVKKARGDYREPKVKWWEIYKIADRAFARRKIKKEISKAAKVKPDFVSKTRLLVYAILFGWFGLHNFYAKNKRKGWLSVICLFISVLSLSLRELPWVRAVETWLIGFNGFVVLFIWITDIVNIMFNSFKYRIQIDKFIASLNVETRAKLGEKYIDLELLHKPWPVRFKVWCQKRRSNYEERKRERRQAMIEREKEKMAKAEEDQKVAQEVAEFEEKENQEIKQKRARRKQMQEEAKQEKTEQKEKPYVQKQAKISVKTKGKTNKSKKR